MKIERIGIEGFGRLRGFDSGSEPLERLVVVLGPNEAGKSTLFRFLTTALYGFQPATRERNPLVPWGADEAAGRIRIHLQEGRCAEVERRLRSQPSTRLTIDGTTAELHNRPVPWVEHVPRTVFGQVFAITLSELAGLDSETWARIQDNVVGSMGASDLRSPRAVAEELEREASEIWRPNRRGNQRLRDLQEDLRQLRARRHAAYTRDARIRSLSDERERTLVSLVAAKEQRQRDRLSLERTRALVPVARQLERIAALRAEGGERDELGGLPPDPRLRFDELEEERRALMARLDALATEAGDAETALAAFDERARLLLARRDDIVRFVARASGLPVERGRVAELEVEVERLRAEERVVRAALEAPPLPQPRSVRRGYQPIVAAGVGTALLAWGSLADRTPAMVFGAALAGIGVALWLATRRGPARSDAAAASTRTQSRARLDALVRERDDCQARLATARARVHEVEASATALAAALEGRPTSGSGHGGVDDAPNAEALAHTLDLDLRRAERAEEAASAAERTLKRLGAERDTVRSKLTLTDPERTRLGAVGGRLAAGDPLAGLDRAGRRLAAHRRADEMEEELERIHPDLEELRARLAAPDDEAALAPPDDEQLVQARTRLEALEEDIERLASRSEALAVEIARLREEETVDAVDGEIANLREAEARLVRERDRKWVLAKLLREADRRFRDEHQPDLLRRASTYLAHLTGGRYERLVVDETADPHLFQVVGPGLPAPVGLAWPVSTGTLEQAYLSLRLAIVDQLDRGGERLPLFIDEVFVNWDEGRRARGLEVLAGIAMFRQVFVFTCHPDVAENLRARGGKILRLGPEG